MAGRSAMLISKTRITDKTKEIHPVGLKIPPIMARMFSTDSRTKNRGNPTTRALRAYGGAGVACKPYHDSYSEESAIESPRYRPSNTRLISWGYDQRAAAHDWDVTGAVRASAKKRLGRAKR